jgi:hypothetical protein
MRRSLPLSFLLPLFAAIVPVLPAQKYPVSIPSLKLADGERVVGFEIHVESGKVAAAPNIPIGWSVSIDNDASWNTSLKALVPVGAAAWDDKFFRKFVIVEREDRNKAPLSVHCDISVTKDFATTRTIHISPREMVLEVAADSPSSSSH